MNVGIPVDRTSSGKEHFEVLDGLRGTAAFLIVLFHAFNYPFDFSPPLHLMHHAYLAVDFFFGLSGFVVAYAYDDRWTRMTVRQFFRIRLIRLHPLVLIGATLGLLGYIFDPFSKAMNQTAAPMLLLAYITSLLLLPSPPVGGRLHETQALNGPAWSLMQEYLGNIAYAADSSQAADDHSGDHLWIGWAAADLDREYERIAGWRLGLSGDVDGAATADGVFRDGSFALSNSRPHSDCPRLDCCCFRLFWWCAFRCPSSRK